MHKYSVEAFLRDCGADRPLLLGVRGPGEGAERRLALHQPFAVLGRLVHADVPLRDAAVHRKHAYLQILEGRVFYVPLTARADGAEGARWLEGGQDLCAGGHRVRLGGEAECPPGGPQDINPLAAGSGTQRGVPSLTLEFLSGDAVRLRWRMNRLLVLLGRSADCKIRIADEAASQFHCALVSTAGGAWLVDLLGRGGVCVNGVQARQIRIEDGDLLRIGNVSVRLRYDDPNLPEAYPPGYLERGRTGISLTAETPPRSAGAPSPDPAPGPALAPLATAAVAPAPLALNGHMPAPPAGAPEQALAAFALPLLQQFNLMQQQMFGQFHQASLQTLQMFNALHQDQVGYLRRELDRQQQITQELRELQAEFSKLQRNTAGNPGGTDPVGQTHAGGVGASRPPAAGPVRPGEADGQGSAPEGGPAAPASGLPNPKGPAVATPVAARQADPAVQARRPQGAGEDVHAWLCQRMACLEQERQSGWQRMLSFLIGRRSEEQTL